MVRLSLEAHAAVRRMPPEGRTALRAALAAIAWTGLSGVGRFLFQPLMS
jgi:hypothetical protein